MTFHKSAKTHHYHIYPPSTISLSSSSVEPTHLTILEKFLLIIITTNKKSQEWKKWMMFDKKLVVKHWFLKQNMPVDFFLSNENFEMSKWVRKWGVFFRFLSNDWKLGFMPLFCLLSRILLKKKCFHIVERVNQNCFKIRIYVLTKIS